METTLQPVLTFNSFRKIPRLRREAVVTEKIDGTNAQIVITEAGGFFTGSRNQWISPENDNFGFAAWAQAHKSELMELGVGTHYGEWWGRGIQRGYGLTQRCFSLFNVKRWVNHGDVPQVIPNPDPKLVKMQEVLPPCVGLVPILGTCMFDDVVELDCIFETLRRTGSFAAPGFSKPEGIAIHHVQGNVLFKRTFTGDEAGKGE